MLVLGIDEVGRGSLAGPLVVGAVLLKRKLSGLTDSKLLSAKQRKLLLPKIYKRALFVGLGWVSSEELDSLGLSKSLTLASKRALSGYSEQADQIILDGNYNYVDCISGCQTLIGADIKVAAVSAASIVAKEARDDYMRNFAALNYPSYGFEFHVGYGTKRHLLALEQYGPCALHRFSFAPVNRLQQKTALEKSGPVHAMPIAS